jgi:hypothetical protein
MSEDVVAMARAAQRDERLSDGPLFGKLADEITRLRAGLQRIVEGDGFWDAPSLARDLLEGKDVT